MGRFAFVDSICSWQTGDLVHIFMVYTAEFLSDCNLADEFGSTWGPMPVSIGQHILHILQLEHKHFPKAYAQRHTNENLFRFEGPKFGSFVTSPFVSFFI